MKGLTARKLELLLRVRDWENARPPQAFDREDTETLLEMVTEGRAVIVGGIVTVPGAQVRGVRIMLTADGRTAITLALIAGVDPS